MRILTTDRGFAMTAVERRAVGTLAGVFSLRMYGLFLVLPVFALYARDLEGATPFLIGLALGIYGLTQALFQIPMGSWSDRLGRKPVILTGLAVFAIGSVIAAVSDTIVGVLIGRALQGAGAIASAVLALAADLTRPQQRTKIMAAIGVSIGAMFVLALMSGPLLDRWIGVPGMFAFAAVLALAAMALVRYAVPDPPAGALTYAGPSRGGLRFVLQDSRLAVLDVGIFVLHAVLTAVFVVVPGLIEQFSGWSGSRHWRIYVPVLLLSVVLMAPLIILHSRGRSVAMARFCAIVILGVSQLALLASPSLPWLVVALWLFFVGFNSLEAMLPSEVSQLAPADRRGAALGVYNTAEFAGVFFGGFIAGLLNGKWGAASVFAASLAMILGWLVFSLRVANRVREGATM